MAQTIRVRGGGGSLVAALVLLGLGFAAGIWFQTRKSAAVVEAEKVVAEVDSAAVPVVEAFDSAVASAREAVEEVEAAPPPLPPDTVVILRVDTLLARVQEVAPALGDSIEAALDAERADHARQRADWDRERAMLWSTIRRQDGAIVRAEAVIASQNVQIAARDDLIAAHEAEGEWDWPRIGKTALVVVPAGAGLVLLGVVIGG